MYATLTDGGRKTLKLKDSTNLTILVNMSGDVGYNAFKQTQLFRQQKNDFDQFPFDVKLHLHQFTVEVAVKAQGSIPVSDHLDLSVEAILTLR